MTAAVCQGYATHFLSFGPIPTPTEAGGGGGSRTVQFAMISVPSEIQISRWSNTSATEMVRCPGSEGEAARSRVCCPPPRRSCSEFRPWCEVPSGTDANLNIRRPRSACRSSGLCSQGGVCKAEAPCAMEREDPFAPGKGLFRAQGRLFVRKGFHCPPPHLGVALVGFTAPHGHILRSRRSMRQCQGSCGGRRPARLPPWHHGCRPRTNPLAGRPP